MFILRFESVTEALAAVKSMFGQKYKTNTYTIGAADKSFFLHFVLPAVHSFRAKVRETWSCIVELLKKVCTQK